MHPENFIHRLQWGCGFRPIVTQDAIECLGMYMHPEYFSRKPQRGRSSLQQVVSQDAMSCFMHMYAS